MCKTCLLGLRYTQCVSVRNTECKQKLYLFSYSLSDVINITFRTKLSPFLVFLFLTAGHQGDHDGAVLGGHGDAVLMDLKSKHSSEMCKLLSRDSKGIIYMYEC